MTQTRSTSGPAYAAVLDFKDTSGTHVISAILQVSPDSSIQLQRSVLVVDPDIQVSASNVVGTVGPVQFEVDAKSDFGVVSVSATLDGASLGSLSAPNAGAIYVFTVDTRVIGSGTHTFVAKATSGNNKSATATRVVTFDNPPLLTVNAPADGSIVNGTLHVAGAASTDKPGGLSIVAKLGDTSVLSTSTSPFATDFNLAAVTPGQYTLTVTATDSTNNSTQVQAIVMIASSPTLVYSPLLTIGTNGSLLAVGDATTVLYRTTDGKLHVQSGSTDTLLDITGLRFVPDAQLALRPAVDWHLENGHVFALGIPLTDIADNLHILHWLPDGSRQDLGVLGNGGVRPLNSANRIQSVRWPWVFAVTPNVSSFLDLVFFNAQTSVKLAPNLPDAARGGDFYLSPGGDINAYYSVSPLPHTGSDPVDIAHWDQGSGNITAITNASLTQFGSQTDGVRVAWQAGPINAQTFPTLVTLNIASNVQDTLSTTLKAPFHLAHGLLAWTEGNSTNTALKVSNGTAVAVISTRTSALIYGVGDGYVLFSEDAKLYVADGAGSKLLVLDGIPDAPQISGKTVYFTSGAQRTLYAITLN